jgi:hypothetical protein
VALSVALVFRKEIVAVFTCIRRLELPGGVALDLNREIKAAEEMSERVRAAGKTKAKHGAPAVPLTEANARMIALGLRPSPSGLDMSYYRNIAADDPNLALAGLRIELDVLTRNLAAGFGVAIGPRAYGERLLKTLHAEGAITTEQMQLLRRVLRVCTVAVHGQPVSVLEAEAILDVAETLAQQYLDWLSWGFDDEWKPSETGGATKQETTE